MAQGRCNFKLSAGDEGSQGAGSCAHLLSVNLTVVVAEQDFSQREKGVMKGKQSWG